MVGSFNRRWSFGPSLLALVLVATGCGSRLSHERLVAEARAVNSGAGGLAASSDEATSGAGGPDVATSGGGSAGSDVAAGGGGSAGSDVAASGGGSASSPLPSSGGGPGGQAGAPGGGSGRAVGTSPGSGAAVPGGGGGVGGAGSGGGPADAPGGSSRCSTSKAPIVIGQVGQNSGVAGAVFVPALQAVQVAVADMNTRGGVACHPIKYITADDGGDPARRQSLVQKLAEQDRVVAFVQMTDSLSGSEGAAKYFEQKRIPVIGDAGGAFWAYSNTMYFPQAATGIWGIDSPIGAVAQVALPKGKTKFGAVYCLEAPVCSSGYPLAEQMAAKYGMKLVYRAQASITQPDYTSICQAAKDAGAEAFFPVMDGNSAVRLGRSCASVSYHPIYTGIGQIFETSESGGADLDGIVYGVMTIPWFLQDNPGVAELQSAYRRYAPGLRIGPNSVLGWMSAKLFELAAQKVSDVPTSQSILEGLWSIKDNDFGGMTMPLTFTEGQPPPNRSCFWIVQRVGGKVITPNDGKRTCG